MNLVIDIGNTSVKLAVFDDGKLSFHHKTIHDNLNDELNKVIVGYPRIKKVLVSSVGKYKTNSLSFGKSDLQIIELTHNLKFPFINKYATPHTLGVDRIALVSAAAKKHPKKNTLIIDAGTCITYDFINRNNEYLGGAISPGLRMRYKALNYYTENLPLLETETIFDITGNSTTKAIHSGVVLGIANEIDGVINRYADLYPDLTVILTGGDCEFLSNQLKNGIFANSNFLLEGLNFILEYNS